MTDTTAAPSTTAGLRRAAALGLAVVLGAATLGACSSDGAKEVSSSGTTLDPSVATSVTEPTDGTGPAASSGSGGGAGQSGDNSGGATGGSSGGSPGGGGSTAATPAFTTVSTPDSIDCHNGDSQQFTASWTTTNATKVTISIDGPGIYAEYPPNGSTSLPFNCSSSHSFLFTAYGADGQKATKEVTLQPRNVQGPSGEETEDADPGTDHP